MLETTEETEFRSLQARVVQGVPLGHSGTPYTIRLNFLFALVEFEDVGLGVGQ